MDTYFATLAARHALSPAAVTELAERGFTVLPGPFAADDVPHLQAEYDAAIAGASPDDVRVGRDSTRVTDFVNRGSAFDRVYTWPPALDACCHVVGRPFRLSAMHARTVRPGSAPQELHVDVPPTSDAWPMLGLILMVDEFRDDNGATRFVPGSHRWTEGPEHAVGDRRAPYPGEVHACGPAGSMILFNASTWHGHTANTTSAPRRSVQATFIPREGRAATDFGARMQLDTLARLGSDARYLLGV